MRRTTFLCPDRACCELISRALSDGARTVSRVVVVDVDLHRRQSTPEGVYDISNGGGSIVTWEQSRNLTSADRRGLREHFANLFANMVKLGQDVHSRMAGRLRAERGRAP